jgi:hypothetical protein
MFLAQQVSLQKRKYLFIKNRDERLESSKEKREEREGLLIKFKKVGEQMVFFDKLKHMVGRIHRTDYFQTLRHR